MLPGGLWMCCVIAAGCYRPSEVACGITCASGACPGGLVCNAADQLCYAPALGSCTDAGGGIAGSGDDGGSRGTGTGGGTGDGCLGHDPFTVCPPAPPNSSQQWGGTLAIDTDACPAALGGQVVMVGSISACAVLATDIVVAATVNVTGSRPLVIAALGAITLTGTIDAASHHGQSGPAASASCTPANPVQDLFGRGGAGGSFQGKGGDGAVPMPDAMASPNTAQPAQSAPMKLAGGCSGGRGNDSSQAGQGSAGGAGGGVLYLVAGDRIAIAAGGWIDASGAAGEAGTGASGGSFGGGGGGGSGGLVRLDAPTVAIEGTIAVNGAGGAGGSGKNSVGLAGGETDPTLPGTPAPGGAADAPGGAGNAAIAGVSGATPAAPGAGSGGGGGGGGAGYLVVVGTRSGSGQISPPPS